MIYNIRKEGTKVFIEVDTETKIAVNCFLYLDAKQISALKSRLIKEWNGRTHCWKGV